MNELPQEIEKVINKEINATYPEAEVRHMRGRLKPYYRRGAEIASAHYAPIIAEKDKEIADLQKKVAELEAELRRVGGVASVNYEERELKKLFKKH